MLLIMAVGIVLSLIVAYWLWTTAEQQEIKLIKNTSLAKSELIRHEFVNTVPNILSSLERMKERWENRGATPYSEWQLDSENYIEDHRGLRAIEWVDQNYVVKWIYPLAGNEAAVDLDLTFEPKRKNALDSAKTHNKMALTKTIDLVQGGKGFLAYFPIYSNDEFGGFILGVFDIQRLVFSLLPQALIDEYNVELYADNQLVFQHADTSQQNHSKYAGSHEFKFNQDQHWQVVVWPKALREEKDHSNIHFIAFAYGCLVSTFAALALIYSFKVKSVQKQIKAREIEHRAIVANAIDGIITINGQGKIRSINNSVEQIFGYKEQDLIGKNIKCLMPEPYHSEHDSYIKNYQQTHQAQIIGIGRIVEGQRESGEIFPLDLGVTEFTIEDSTYFCGVVRDITKQVEQEQERESLIAKLKISNEELDNFAYIASHDLKEPLRAIQNHADFLKQDYQSILDEDGVYKLNRLIYLSEKMEKLISDLLYFSRLGRENLSLTHIDMNLVVNEVLDRLAEKIQQLNVVVTSHPLPPTYGDKTRIQEVFYNLIINAYKYNTSPAKHIEIGSVKDNSGNTIYFVSDNGIGIDMQFKREIFRIFKRLNSVKKYGEGSGAGLTFVKKIIEQHNGKIWFDSALGKGTTFYFTLEKERDIVG